jgi:Mn-dependent DtxR family transcriptional regulator
MGPIRSRLLRYLDEHQGRKVTTFELEEQLKIDFSTIKGMIEVLRWEGFVEQTFGTCATITPKGIDEVRKYH